MKTKQIFSLSLLSVASMGMLALVPASTTFAVSKNKWVSILCDDFAGPSTSGGTLADDCKKDAKDGTLNKKWYDKAIKYENWKDKSAAELYEHIGKTPPDDSGDDAPADDLESDNGDTILGSGSGDGCGGVDTAIIKCDQDNSGTDIDNNGIWGLLLIAINILTAGVGVLAVGGIVYAAVLYTTAEDRSDQIKKSTDIITNVVIGLAAFALMWAGLNFLIPGGVFS